MASLRERRRIMLRDDIIEAARALVAERGFHAMSMEELAARVGVSKPTLYNQFPTKEHLLVASAAQGLERIVAFAQTPSEASPIEQLSAILTSVIQTQIESGALVAQIWMPELLNVLRSHESTAALLVQIDAIVNRLVKLAQQAGEIDPQFDVPTVIRAYYALLCAPTFGTLGETGNSTPDTNLIAPTLATLFRRGVVGK